jgi:hypothetical protein
LFVEFRGRDIKKSFRRTLRHPVVCQDQNHADAGVAIGPLVIAT